MSPPNRENEEDLLRALRPGRSYASIVRLALLGLLAGGGLLAGARVLRLSRISESLTLSAALAEFLGWFFLASSTAILWTELEGIGKPDTRSDRSLFDDSGWIGTKRVDLWCLPENSCEDAIDNLYAELRPLMSRAVSDPSLREEVDARLSRIRELQSKEADEMQKRFEAGLLLKPGEGRQALDRADELLARYENPSSPNPTPERHR